MRIDDSFASTCNTSTMVEGEINSHPIQVLVNYWETRPSSIGACLDDLLRSGITNIATFVPWQAVESDISHTLVRFLHAVADRRMSLSLILTPEVGVHYPNCGLPRDVSSKADRLAHSVDSKPVNIALPPNIFSLPSLSSSEFLKRYYNFLSRIDSLLADLSRTQPYLVQSVTAVLTGCYWKYYRSARYSALDPFHGSAGDYSPAVSVQYRQRVEQFYSQKEFSDPTPFSANRWKTRALEDVNRRWFFQHLEDLFKSRSSQFVKRKAANFKLKHFELFTPEADPGFAFSNFFQVVSGSGGDFSRLSSLVDHTATRMSHYSDKATVPFIHWTNIGAFRSLSDAEKQFLILKSILLAGSRGGGILIDENEWLSLSHMFRSRAEALSKSISVGDLWLKNRVLYLTTHLWSDGGIFWNQLQKNLGANVRLVSSLDLVLRDHESSLIFIDPKYIFTQEALTKLLGLASSGRVVVMPRTPLFTEAARSELEAVLAAGGSMQLSLGVPYQIQPTGDGKLILFDPPESTRTEDLESVNSFVASVLAVANLSKYCSSSDSRLNLIPLEKRDGGIGLFILNGTTRKVTADLLFDGEVTVSDLAASFAAARGGQEQVVPSVRFSLEVPPCGILPLAVDGLGIEAEERRAAAVNAEVLKENIMEAAVSELPGFSSNHDIEATWN